MMRVENIRTAGPLTRSLRSLASPKGEAGACGAFETPPLPSGSMGLGPHRGSEFAQQIPGEGSAAGGQDYAR